MNRDEGSYQLSHAYDRFLDATAYFFHLLKCIRAVWPLTVQVELHVAEESFHVKPINDGIVSQCSVMLQMVSMRMRPLRPLSNWRAYH